MFINCWTHLIVKCFISLILNLKYLDGSIDVAFYFFCLTNRFVPIKFLTCGHLVPKTLKKFLT